MTVINTAYSLKSPQTHTYKVDTHIQGNDVINTTNNNKNHDFQYI